MLTKYFGIEGGVIKICIDGRSRIETKVETQKVSRLSLDGLGNLGVHIEESRIYSAILDWDEIEA